MKQPLHNSAFYRKLPFYSGHRREWLGLKLLWSFRKRVAFCIFEGKP